MSVVRPIHLGALMSMAALSVACAGTGPTAEAMEEAAEPVEYQAETVVDGLDSPWGMTFIPGGDADQALITELAGTLNRVDLETGERTEIDGIPTVAAVGQGGLLDVALHPRFEEGERWVYLSYSAEGDGTSGYATHVGRGLLDDNSEALTDFEVLLVAEPFGSNTGHFGSRLVFGADDYLYITTGDRRDRNSAQDLQSHWGKTLRIDADGGIPEDNPFVGDGDALDAIYTYGHRNAQGMTVHPETNDIWQNEHGQQNGDLISVIDTAGGNHGWPVATYSREYGSGAEIGDLPHERDDIVDPVYYWDGTRYDHRQEGFPPSGMAFYHGDDFPEWEGDLFMGNLAHEYLARFETDGREVVEEHRLLGDRDWRIRDVRVHPDSGEIYVLVDRRNAPLVRIRRGG